METPECIAISKVQPKEHQLKIINLLLKEKRSIGVIHTTGSGKTLSAVISARCFLDNNDGFVFVVAPASLRDNYIKEYVNSYESFDPRIQIFTPETFSRSPQNLTGSMLIVDEAHVFRTKIVTSSSQDEARKGKKASVLVNAALNAKKVILLTATPVVNTEYDLENLLALLDARKPMGERAFMKILGNSDEKRKMLEGRFDFYSPAPEDLAKYPKFEVQPVFFEMPPGIYQEYKRQEDFLRASGPKFDNFIVDSELEGDLTKFYTGLRFAANLNEGESDAALELDKASWISAEMRKTKGEKWLIYSSFVYYGIDIVAKVLADSNIDFEKITGKIPPDARQGIVDKVNEPISQDSNSIALLITGAGGTGLDLKGFTRVVILESPWNFAMTDQVFGRAVRYNSLSGTPYDTVRGYLMMMVKPNEYAAGVERVIGTHGNMFGGELKSIDLLLYARSLAKKKRVDNLINDMKIYNTEFEKISAELEKGGARIVSDLVDFQMSVSCGPAKFEIESDRADIDSHTIIFVPNEPFRLKFYVEIFEFPCLSVSALERAFPLPKDAKVRLFENSQIPGMMKVCAAFETLPTDELTFDNFVESIRSVFSRKFDTKDFIPVVTAVSAWIKMSDPRWNHGKFILANIWARTAQTDFINFITKYSGETLYEIKEYEVQGREINLFMNRKPR